MNRPYFESGKVGFPLKGPLWPQISRLHGVSSAVTVIHLNWPSKSQVTEAKDQNIHDPPWKPRNVEIWRSVRLLTPVLARLRKVKQEKFDLAWVVNFMWRLWILFTIWAESVHLRCAEHLLCCFGLIDYFNRTHNYHGSINLCLVSNMQTSYKSIPLWKLIFYFIRWLCSFWMKGTGPSS